MSSDVETIEPINNIYAGGSRRARQLAEAVPSIRPSRPTSARSRMAATKTKKGRVTPLGPTAERLAKGDVVRTTGGAMVAQDGLETLRRTFKSPDFMKAQEVLARLHHRVSLDHDPGMNDRMFEAGKSYERLAHLAGLGGVAAQNLLSSGGGGGDPANMMPVSEASAAARLRIRKAWTILGSRGASAMHGIIVEGREPEAIGREVSTYRSKSECTTAGLTALRIALWTLVDARWA